VTPRDATAGPVPADPIAAAFLGRQAGVGGPFALLGVTHEQRSPTDIRAAAARRLTQVDRHSLRLTPEADEIRLAIHAAVAQLSDPALHAELVRHWPPGEPEQIPIAWRSHLDAVSETLARRARQIIGASGGWNPRAKKRLAHIARLHRVAATDLLRAVRPDGKTNSRGHGAGTARRPAVMPVIAGPISTGRFWLLLHASLTVMLVFMLTLTGLELFAPREERGQPLASRTPVEPAGPVDSGPLVPGPRSSIEHHAALEQELRNILLMASSRPDEAGSRGGRAVGTFLQRWSEATPEARDRITGLVIELASWIAASQSASDALLAPIRGAVLSGNPASAASGAALAAMLRDAPDLPRPFRERATEIASPFGIPLAQRFDQAVIDALRSQIDTIGPDSVALWRAWSDALAAAAGGSPAARVQTRLLALESILRRTEAPTQDWRPIASVLATGLTWRPGDPARAWMLEQMDDPAVRTDRLGVLTDVLATEVSAPGIDPGMVLAPDAEESARRSLTAAYRAEWVSVPSGDATVRAEVIAALSRSLVSPPAAPADRLTRLIELARANAAAALLFTGDDVGAAELLAQQTPGLLGTGPVAPGPAPTAVGDAWGIELLNANAPDRILALFRQARSGRPELSTLAAEAMVHHALLGPNREVRETARAMVVSFGADVQLLLAVERAAMRRPTAAAGELVTAITGLELPDRRNDAWPDRVRAALLPRIADRAAGDDPDGLVLVELTLAELNARRSDLSTHAPYLRSLLDETGAWLARNDLPDSDPLSPVAIDARRNALGTSAAARAQMAAVQHRALVEAVAGVAVSHAIRPRPGVERLLARMAGEWAGADTVIDQLIVSHRAESELWRSMLEANP
jgi:hypothetical protein